MNDEETYLQSPSSPALSLMLTTTLQLLPCLHLCPDPIWEIHLSCSLKDIQFNGKLDKSDGSSKIQFHSHGFLVLDMGCYCSQIVPGQWHCWGGEWLSMLRFLKMSELSPLRIVTDVAARFDRKWMESWCKQAHVVTSASECHCRLTPHLRCCCPLVCLILVKDASAVDDVAQEGWWGWT